MILAVAIEAMFLITGAGRRQMAYADKYKIVYGFSILIVVMFCGMLFGIVFKGVRNTRRI